MYSNLIALFLGVLHIANAAFVPKGTPDGLYVSLTHPNGTEYIQSLDIHELSTLKNASSITARGELTKRSGCVNGALNHANTLSAVGSWRSFCGTGKFLPGPNTYFYVSGTAVAYICVFVSWGGTCSNIDINTAVNHITASCGSYVPGWYSFDSQLTYGYDFTGRSICLFH